jgi:NmrA-like family protein/SnoaL-like protein
MAQELTIVVTGSTGKQGGAIARGLLERGHKVRAVTRDPNSSQAKLLRENRGDSCCGVPRRPFSDYKLTSPPRSSVRPKGDTIMSYSISTLLIRNLHDVFGENDPARRRVALDELWNEDGVFYDPSKGAFRGRDEIDRIAGTIKAAHPDFQYQPISQPEELGNGGRVKWVAGRPGAQPSYAGTDFLIARDGRIAALYLFFDELP